MNSTVLMILFVLGVVGWLMVLTGLTGNIKKEAHDALLTATKGLDSYREYRRLVSDTMSTARDVNTHAKEVLNYDRQLVNNVASLANQVDTLKKTTIDLSEAVQVLIKKYPRDKEIKENSNDREQDKEDGDDLEGGDPETVGQGSP